MYDRVNKYTAKSYWSWMDKLSPRDCVDLLFVREICCPIVSNISRTHGGYWFFLLLEMRDLDKLKSKLEMIMEKRMHDTCEHNIKGNVVLSIDFPFTSKLKLNCLFLT